MVSDLAITFFLSLRVSLLAMLIVLPVGLWCAWRLTLLRRLPGRVVLETILFLPLVLPPTVVGYGLLVFLGRGSAVGRWLQDFLHVTLLFTWQGAGIAVAIMAFPLFVRSAVAAFAAVDRDLIEMGRTLGASDWRILRTILIPLSYHGLVSGSMLAFARAIGEFGATLMVAGAIPGETETLPLALYSAVQTGDNARSMQYAALLCILAFGFLSFSLWWSDQIEKETGERRD